MIAVVLHALLRGCVDGVQPMAEQCKIKRCCATREKSSTEAWRAKPGVTFLPHKRISSTESSQHRRLHHEPASFDKNAYTAKMPPKAKVARAPQENIQLGPQVREVRDIETNDG